MARAGRCDPCVSVKNEPPAFPHNQVAGKLKVNNNAAFLPTDSFVGGVSYPQVLITLTGNTPIKYNAIVQLMQEDLDFIFQGGVPSSAYSLQGNAALRPELLATHPRLLPPEEGHRLYGGEEYYGSGQIPQRPELVRSAQYLGS